MAVQIPLQFEFSSDQTFNDYYAGENREIVDHLQGFITKSEGGLIYLWGDQGLGKSHLLQACGQMAQRNKIRSFFLSLSLQGLTDPSILEGLEEIEMVCIDDLNRIAGNDPWELAFFSFFNRIRDQGHRLIVSAPAPPNELPIRLPDLKTRLSWGLTLKLKSLTEQERVSALSYKARKTGLEISPQVGRFLLTHYSRDLPSLWALLEKIDHETLAAKRKLTIPFLKQILKNTV